MADDYQADTDLTEENRKFTLEEYIEYLKADQYELDGFETFSEYTSSWCAKIKDWHAQSEKDSSGERAIWDVCYKALKSGTMKSASASPHVEENIAAARIPILKNEMLDEVAALYSNDFIPTLSPMSDQAKPFCALGNIYLSREFKINKWRSLKFTLGVDGFVTDMWVVKTGTTDLAKGPFGQNEKVTMSRIDPRCFFPDMRAQTMTWDAMDYIIVTDSLDIGVARNMFKDKAKFIDLALAEPDEPRNRRYGAKQLVVLPGQRGTTEGATDRVRIKIKECWVHDERYKFVAESYEDVADNSKTKIRLDADGYVKGTWEKAYPYGRMIVTANDKIILRDVDNPFWHREAPFIICTMSPRVGGDLLTVGKAADILGFERKTNDFESRVHSYGQAEIERPMQADTGALVNNTAWYRTTGQSRAILLKAPGKAFMRPMPVEIPQFVDSYLGRLNQYRHETTGRPPIMTGQIAEGSQLGAQSMKDAQGFGATRMGMGAIMIAEAMVQLGTQMFELVRETYPNDKGLGAMITLPDGTQKEIKWNEAEFADAYVVDIDLQSGSPGGKQALASSLERGFEKGLYDRQYVYQSMGIDGWQEMLARFKQQAAQLIFDQAAGRAAGLQIKEVTKLNTKPGRTDSA